MRGKLRVAVLTLLAITVVYAVALYLSIQRYNAWQQSSLESLPPEVRPWVDFDPYWNTPEGLQLFYFGCFLIISWGLSALIRMTKVK